MLALTRLLQSLGSYDPSASNPFHFGLNLSFKAIVKEALYATLLEDDEIINTPFYIWRSSFMILSMPEIVCQRFPVFAYLFLEWEVYFSISGIFFYPLYPRRWKLIGNARCCW